MSGTFIVDSKSFFTELLDKGFSKRKVSANPAVKIYMADLLSYYLDAKNLFDYENKEDSGQRPLKTLAEIYLTANQSEPAKKADMLKRMADRCLYMTGFFGDSFQRKIIDVDYYCSMGETAYADLASTTREDFLASTYSTFSKRFVEFVDVLTFVAQDTAFGTNRDVLRLYERYLKTGSVLAREQLINLGVITFQKDGTSGTGYKS